MNDESEREVMKKNREELLHSHYFTIAEIQRLLDVSRKEAKRIYKKADDYEKRYECYRTNPTKVKLRTICMVEDIDMKYLENLVLGNEKKAVSKK